MKIKKIHIIFILLISILITFGTYLLISNAEMLTEPYKATEFGARYVTTETELGNNTVLKTVIKPYVYHEPSYKRIDKFPIDNYVFNSCPDYFCAQHGTPYASSFKNYVLGESPDFHEYHYGIVSHNFTSYTTGNLYTYASNPTEDVPTYNLPRVYIDANGNLKQNTVITSGEFDGYKESDEDPNNTIFTNWVFIPHEVQFDCETKVSRTGVSRN